MDQSSSSSPRDAGPLPSPNVRHRLARRGTYSWRGDAAVPPFPDDLPLVVFDGVCVLCSGFAQFVVRRDRSRRFRLTAAQSPLGQALFRHYGLDPDEFETNLLIEDGRAYGKLDAFARIMAGLGGVMGIAAVTRAIPAAVGDPLYDAIARNRYRLFGRREVCMMPGEAWRDRVLYP